MDYSPENMARELKAAKRNAQNYLRVDADLKRRYCGPYWRDDEKEPAYDPENHAYEWINNVQSQIVGSNPKWKLRSRRGPKYALVAGALEIAMNRWNVEYDFQGFLTSGPVLDMHFSYGVAFVSLEDYEGYTSENGPDEPKMPCCEHIAPTDFVWDPVPKNKRYWKYQGHRIVADKDELLERADNEDGWDKAVLESVVSSLNQGETMDARRRDGIQRDEIVYWELYCPKLQTRETQEEDDELGAEDQRVGEATKKRSAGDSDTGTILTILDREYNSSDKTSDKWVRKPRAYYGPKCGPYVVFSALGVPGDSMPLAPLVALYGQTRELNATSRAITTALDSFKRFVVTSDKKLATAIKDNPTLTVLHSDVKVRDEMAEFTVGGAAPEQLQGYQFKRERVDRNSGLTEASRGNTTTGATATADILANEGSSRRIFLLKENVTRATLELGRIIAWYFFHEPDIEMLVGEVQGAEVWVRGGFEDDNFRAYELEIEIMSMERISPAQQQAQAAFLLAQFPAVAAAMPAQPWVDWQRYWSTVGERVGIPDLASYFHMEALQQAAQQVQQQAEQPQPQTPRLMPKPAVPTVTAHGPARPASQNGKYPSSPGQKVTGGSRNASV